jgi:hypothetical protein
MRKSSFLLVLAVAVLALSLAGSAFAQEKADTAKIVGTWKIDVYAGDTTYNLNLVVTEDQGQLAGKISESMGTFADVAINDIFYDSVTFRFSFVSPTPPDGLSRTVKADFKVAADAMEGTVSVPDMDTVVDAKANRETRRIAIP